LILGRALFQQPLDDHAVAPATIQFSMPVVDSDFLEPELLQKGAASRSSPIEAV
jgi:hypothetical protein